MQNQFVVWAISIVAACWIIVIAHQVGWPAIDPKEYGAWRAALYIAYPTVFVTTGALVAAILLALNEALKR